MFQILSRAIDVRFSQHYQCGLPGGSVTALPTRKCNILGPEWLCCKNIYGRAAKGEWVAMNDPLRSMAADYSQDPKTTEEAIEKYGIVTSWRTERLREMTYTQFLILLREGHIERVRYSDNMKRIHVTTKETCPGRGKVTESVGLIYDPELYDNLCAHGVAVDFGSGHKMAGVQAGILRMFGPVLVTLLVVGWSLTLGRSPDADDPLFGGARMELIRSKDVQTTFADVAGIDDIKGEIMEVVSFLQDQVRH
jgi:ATP-dependent Zn protease